MARKRMISPEIWESQNFSELSDLSKIVFISLFSHADDEGRGRAGAGFIKNMTFPYDENRRVADIKQALSEIALRMSVQFYSVNGSDYYVMTHWERWQKVEKPSKSKLPPPPYVGEGGGILNNEKFPESSPNSRGIFPESSPTNRIERNRIERNIPPSAGAGVEEELKNNLRAFCDKWDIAIDTNTPLIADLDFNKLDEAYSESTTLLQDKGKAPYAHTLSWVVKSADSIYAGKYKDKLSARTTPKAERNQQTSDMLKGIFNHYKAEEDGNATN